MSESVTLVNLPSTLTFRTSAVGQLLYFKDQTQEAACGTIDVRRCTKISTWSETQRATAWPADAEQRGFALYSPGRVYYIYCESDESYGAWTASLANVIARVVGEQVEEGIEARVAGTRSATAAYRLSRASLETPL